jgi:alpha-galactosidase
VYIRSGPLFPNDQVVIFLNAADEDLEMSATLADMFVYEGPEGSAPQVKGKHTFAVHDLWATRMKDSVANAILGGNGKAVTGWYNATEASYQAGLVAGDERLFGKKVGEIGGDGRVQELRAVVPRHGVKAYRLRGGESSVPSKYRIFKDEL